MIVTVPPKPMTLTIAMTTNKKLGNDFEAELCDLLFKNGFWVHNFAMNKSGQPADIIAVKNKTAYLIDAKVCSNGKFKVSRKEENQELSMTLWNECGNGQAWFAMKLDESIIYMVPHFCVQAFTNYKCEMTVEDIVGCGKPFEKWVKRCK